ncbi:hypothetical protein B296_00050391 [Ensete ventricosum]|uniref:Mitochondrial pyruvate carrier n=1 Tax=Ensete ventricosum TaxID=4639 RepID=A0A426YLF3_ENSVE|nr:hypothetical protein B296_00050391 [Ensete ventricosum]
MAAFKAFWNSPVGPKTTHFWGPVANWGFVVAVCFHSISDTIYNIKQWFGGHAKAPRDDFSEHDCRSKECLG